MQQIKTGTSAQELIAERLGKAPRMLIDPKERAARRGADIMKELAGHFRFKTVTTKRLAIEEQADELSKPPKIVDPPPPEVVLGGDTPAPDERLERERRKKLRKRLRIITDGKRAKQPKEPIQGIVVAPGRRSAAQGTVVPSVRRGVVQGTIVNPPGDDRGRSLFIQSRTRGVLPPEFADVRGFSKVQ